MPRLPAEWEPQSALMLTWPHAQGDWDDGLADVEASFIDIAVAVAAFQPLIISVYDTGQRDRVFESLTARGIDETRLNLYVVRSNDVWARDHGPVSVMDDEQGRLLDFRFDGWGNKYPAAEDDQLCERLQQAGAFGHTPLIKHHQVLEGGAIDSNGQGSLLTTQRCLLSRNKGTSEADYERLFKQQFGTEQTLWLTTGSLIGDDTDGHIDTLARFVSPTRIAYQSCDDKHDAHYEALQAMAKELAAFRTMDNQPFELIALPLPQAIHARSGQRLPAGYANFLIINNAVLMPSYDDPADDIAAQLLAQCFTERELITIDCRALIQQYGSLHCVTMQITAL